jgi:DNA-directed RNA polymerase beta' subunit
MEMNMHVPQSVITETELRHLAATPYQIINPGSNKPIIGIFQDSLLGSFRFTREDIHFTPLQAMGLLMMYPHVDVDELRRIGNEITSFDILSQITPPLTLKYKTGLFEEGEDDPKSTNNMLEIRAGKYIRGQLEKGVFDAATKGILHRICNDFGNMACADYNDNLQNIVTEYMKTSSFSVGISDLIADRKTNEEIAECIKRQKVEVQTIIDKVHLGIFENTTANSNMTQFELGVSNILNKATENAGKIGKKSLSKDNRFLMIVNSGSKGNLINISQMISCLGQQSVDGKRISYGFDDRTLPHFKKYDDSPSARGFVENSYITGLTAPELFFHAMAGRTGLIDTAVKSVTWETPIVIIQNGKPLYTEIGRWIDGQLDAPDNKENIEHSPNDRNLELLNIQEGNVYIPTTDEDGHMTWGDVTAITRHDPGHRLYEVISQSGRKVTVAESQSLLVWDTVQEKFVPKPSPEVQLGDFMPVTMSLDPPPILYENERFDVDKEVEHISNGIFNAELMCAYTKIINQIINQLCEKYKPTEIYSEEKISTFNEQLFSIPGWTYKRNPVIIHVKSLEAMNGLSLLCSRVDLPTTLDTETYTVTISYDRIKNIKHDVVLDPIVSIQIVGVEQHPKLYDLTIPSTLNFGLANGLQVRDTSATGYIQRRLVKGLEDLLVGYDMTVRNNKGKIIQFQYGDDHFDSMKVENQILPVIDMTIEDIYMHYDLPGMVESENTVQLSIFTQPTITRMKKQREQCKDTCRKYTENLIEARDLVVTRVFNNQNEKSIRIPVAFQYIIANIQGQLHLDENTAVDVTPLECFEMVEEYYQRINSIACIKTNRLFEITYYYYLNPRDLLVKRRFHQKGLILLLETILLKFKEALVHPGEMVGVVAAQSIGEPSTQLTLNSIIWSEKIILRNKIGCIKIVPIGQFTEEQIEKSKKIDYMSGTDTTYAELNSDEEYYEVPCANESGETVWRRVEAVTQHPVVNEDGTDTMLKVTTKGGREVTATKAKSFLQLFEGKIQGVNGKDLKVGDYLPVSRKILAYTETFALDLRSILSPTKYLYGTELEKAANLRHERHWWKNHANVSFVLPHTSSQSLSSLFREIPQKGKTPNKYLEIHPGYIYSKSMGCSKYMIPESIDLTYDFGYLVGAYAAEGSGGKNKVSICNNCDEYLKPIERLCEQWNIPTKKCKRTDRGGEGWTSQELIIHNTILSNILVHLCGTMSYNKYVSPTIVFSNRECIMGFLDAYIGGDGSVSKHTNQGGSTRISDMKMWSTSPALLTDVMVMLKNVGVSSHIYKIPERKPSEHKIQHRRPSYSLNVKNQQSQKLAQLLHLQVPEKQMRLDELKTQDYFKYEYSLEDQSLPNTVNGEIVMEPREGRMTDLEFDEIISIEEVVNPTKYAYDLTVEDTRNFDLYNGLCLRDTFHHTGISSKTNVTRGVPRIEEILRLTKNPKNPSMTVYLHPLEESDNDKANNYTVMITHTKLVDVVKMIQICFDPMERTSEMDNDQMLLEQYYQFEEMVEECMGNEGGASASASSSSSKPEPARSKWIIRMEIDKETLIEKNITMDDIHFAIANSEHGKDIQCIFSDYNMDKLIFRIRTNANMFDKKAKRGVANPLDQSDDIYLLKHFQDVLLNQIVLRGIHGIQNVIPRKLQNMVVKDDGKYVRKDTWVLDTTGSNLLDTLALSYIDSTRTTSNDIKEVFNILGIEAARQCIHNELVEVMAFAGASINYHHTSLLCDRMTCNQNMVSIFRSGLLNDNVGPIAKATFEVHTEVFLTAARHAEFDHMRGVSANIMCGQQGNYGTNTFQVILDMKAYEGVTNLPFQRRNIDAEIEQGIRQAPKEELSCSQIEIQNNITNIKQVTDNVTLCYDDGYNAGF